jgi:hypothetical protein
MIWRRRCLVLVPVLSFLAAALIMSCGGGSSSTTITAVNSLSVVGLNVCAGPPPTPTTRPTPTPSPTPKPTPTPKAGVIGDDASEATPEVTKTPTPTPTPICTPIVTSAVVGTGSLDNQVQFNAQGVFALTNTSTKLKYRDVTDKAMWSSIARSATYPGFIVSQQPNGFPGLFIGVMPGCTYFTVSDAGFFQNILVGVNVDPATCPTPPGSPATTVPAATPTPKP